MINFDAEIKYRTFSKNCLSVKSQDMPVESFKERGLKAIRGDMVREISGIYGPKESKSIVEHLFYHLAGVEKKEFLLDPYRNLVAGQVSRLREALKEVKNQKPVQYVSGKADFYGLIFEVDERVMIPRPETEELVNWVLEDFRYLKGGNIVDLGTGSGCIAVSLKKKMPDANVYATDISDKALAVAGKNASTNKTTIKFIEGDILVKDVLPGDIIFDIIISNPPYVTVTEKYFLQKNVLDFEPHLALFVHGDDPLVFYRAIAELAVTHLAEKGAVYVEINERYGERTAQIFKNQGFSNVEVRKDLNGKQRMVRASKQAILSAGDNGVIQRIE